MRSTGKSIPRNCLRDVPVDDTKEDDADGLKLEIFFFP